MVIDKTRLTLAENGGKRIKHAVYIIDRAWITLGINQNLDIFLCKLGKRFVMLL